jgi:hypothetical protein
MRFALLGLVVVGFVVLLGWVITVSLPGDWAYAVKVGGIEKVEEYFAFTADAEARQAATFAERRVQEIEDLAYGKRLTPEIVSRLTKSFQGSVATVQMSIHDLSGSAPEKAAVISSHLQAVLSAHVSILRILTPDASVFIAAMEKAQVDLAAGSHNALQSIVAGRGTVITKGYALEAIADAKKQIDATKKMLTSTSAPDSALQLSVASDALASAELKLQANEYGAAFELSERAWRKATIILITEKAAAKFGIGIGE